MARRRGPRRVRTASGAKLFGQPIGTIITRDMVEAAKAGMGVAQAARERTGGTDRRSGPRPVSGVTAAEVRRVAGTKKKGKKPSSAKGGAKDGAKGTGSATDAPDAKSSTPAPPNAGTPPKKGGTGTTPPADLPEGHRFSADKLEERVARYEEAIEDAKGDTDTMLGILEVLEEDEELTDEQFDAVLDRLTADLKAKEQATGTNPKPDPAPETPAAPEAAPEPPAAPKDAPKATAKKKSPSEPHMNKLLDLAETATRDTSDDDASQLLDEVERKADNWRDMGYLDDEMHKAVLDAVKTRRKGAGLWTNRGRTDEPNSAISMDVYQPDQIPEDADTGEFTVAERQALISPKEVDPGHQAYLDGLAENPDATPAGKALAKGASLDGLDDPEGLEQYIKAHPERFEIKMLGGGQSGSDVMSVYDSEKDSHHLYKRSNNDGPVGSTGDAVNEVLSGKLGVAAFPEMFLDADFAERPEHGGNVLISMTHIDEKAKQAGSTLTFYDSQLRDPDAQWADRKQPLVMHVFDFLTNQNDRHLGNSGWFETADGIRLLPTDNANAFNAYNEFVTGYMDDEFDTRTVDAPETMNYADWSASYMTNEKTDVPQFINKQVFAARDVMIAYENNLDDWDNDIAEIVKTFKEVDIDALIADLYRRFPNMDDYEKNHIEAAKAIWKNRVSFMDTPEFADDVFDHMTAALML